MQREAGENRRERTIKSKGRVSLRWKAHLEWRNKKLRHNRSRWMWIHSLFPRAESEENRLSRDGILSNYWKKARKRKCERRLTAWAIGKRKRSETKTRLHLYKKSHESRVFSYGNEGTMHHPTQNRLSTVVRLPTEKLITGDSILVLTKPQSCNWEVGNSKDMGWLYNTGITPPTVT